MPQLLDALERARNAASLTWEELAARAGIDPASVRPAAGEAIDPPLSALVAMARALGLDLVLVPAGLVPELDAFIRSGGRLLGQPSGVSAPPSIVDVLARLPRDGDRPR